jgi:DNA polymerase elongation subunit (family B)
MKKETLQYANIDVSTASKDDIKAEIDRLKMLSQEYYAEEQSVKLILNSIYGGLANQYFVAFNVDTAEAVTLQGQDLIKYADAVLDKYFRNFWHLDKELHKVLNLTGEVRPVTKNVGIYCDTDSAYITFEDVIKSCNFDYDPLEFIIKMSEFRIGPYLDKCFETYAKKRNTTNYQDFELETISHTGIWLGKKKYVLDISWKITKVLKTETEGYKYDGINVKSLNSIVYKGIEIIQGSTPPFIRERMPDLLKYILIKKKNIVMSELLNMMKTIKKEFKLEDPERISEGSSISDYSTYVLNDSTGLEFASRIPIHVRAAAYYNYQLNRNQKLKDKYEIIKAGDKLKYYYTKEIYPGEEENVFAYLPGSYPIEIAPEMDHDLMFTKGFVNPLNRIIKAMGMPEINPGLISAKTVF